MADLSQLSDEELLAAAGEAPDVSQMSNADLLAASAKRPPHKPNKPLGPQPSMMDRAIASPVGRAAQAFIAPISQMAGVMAQNEPRPPGMMGPDMPAYDVAGAVDRPYQAALARNRNTPGYADARAEADARMQSTGAGGMSDQFIASFAPAMAGVAGIPGGFDAMNANADAQQAAQDAYTAEHPVLSFGAQTVGGALAAPKGLPRVVPAYAEDSRLVSRLAGANTQGPLPRLPSKSPDYVAKEYVRRVMETSKKSTDDLAAFDFGGKPVTTAEAIGKQGEVAVGALARREGATADSFRGLAQSRTAGAPNRILDDYAAASGIHPDAARGNIEAFIESNQKAAGPLYDEAYKANTNISSPMLDRILETPAGKQAFASARVKMQNDMKLMGTPDAELMDQAREGGTLLPRGGAASGMKLRVYDYVKRSLDDQISAAYKAGNKTEGNIIKDLKDKLVKELEDADVTAKAGPNSVKPEGGLYKQAREKAGEYLSAKEQFELGQKMILDDKMSARDFAEHLAKLGDAGKQANLGGAANKLFALQQSGKLRASIFKSPGIRAKLEVAMGKDKASAFIRNMENEATMAEFIQKRAPGAGSPTEEYRQAILDQDGPTGAGSDAINFGVNAVQQGPVRAGMNLAINKGKDAAARWTTRGMPVDVRDEAGRLFLLPPSETASILANAPKLPPQGLFSRPRMTDRAYGLLGSSAARPNPKRP